MSNNDDNSFFRALRGEPVPDKPAPEPQRPRLTPEAAIWYDKYTRLRTDYELLKKRQEQRIEQRVTQEKADLLDNLLPVLDNLERALAHAGDDDSDALRGGVEMTAKAFREALAAAGIVPVEALGQPFNPQEHEAIASIDPQPGQTPGTVVAVEQSGYRLGDHLIRPARVIIAGDVSGTIDTAGPQLV